MSAHRMIYTARSLGTTWGPADGQMRAERDAGIFERLPVGVQVALRRRQRTMPRDLAEHMYRNTGGGHSGQTGVP